MTRIQLLRVLRWSLWLGQRLIWAIATILAIASLAATSVRGRRRTREATGLVAWQSRLIANGLGQRAHAGGDARGIDGGESEDDAGPRLGQSGAVIV